MSEKHCGKHGDRVEEAQKMIDMLDRMYHEKPVGFMAFLMLSMSRRHQPPFPMGPWGGPPLPPGPPPHPPGPGERE